MFGESALHPSKKRIYWLALGSPLGLTEKVALLSRNGYGIRTFDSLDSLQTAMTLNRASIIVISEDGPRDAIDHAIIHLSTMPMCQGVRFVLSLGKKSTPSRSLAAACNFRELLPKNLNDDVWIRRFGYCTNRHPEDQTLPIPAITLSNSTAVTFPARIVWISDDKLLLESKVQPDIGDSLSISGGMANSLGVKSININVVDRKHTNLKFRFSDATVATWHVPPSQNMRRIDMLNKLKMVACQRRYRVFLAVQDQDIRSEALSKLDHPQFEIKMPLHRQHIVDEPRFISPDLVIIEDSLCVGENRELFLGMLDHIDRGVHVIILSKDADSPRLRRENQKNSGISIIKDLPQNLPEHLIENFLKNASSRNLDIESNAIMIPPEHPVSFAETRVSGKIIQLHPTAVQIALTTAIGRFGIAKIESPTLKRVLGDFPFAKVNRSYKSEHAAPTDALNHIIECNLSDTDDHQQSVIATSIVRAISDRFGIKKDSWNHDRQAEAVAKSGTISDLKKPIPSSGENKTASESFDSAMDGSAAFKIAPLESIPLPKRVDVDAVPHRQQVMPLPAWEQWYKKLVKIATNKTLLYLAIFVIFSATFAFGIAEIVDRVSVYYSRSGKEYTDSLIRMIQKNNGMNSEDGNDGNRSSDEN